MPEYKVKISSVEKIEKFVQITSSCEYEIDLVHDHYTIDAKSIVGLFTMNLSKPLNMVVHGDECTHLLKELENNHYLDIY